MPNRKADDAIARYTTNAGYKVLNEFDNGDYTLLYNEIEDIMVRIYADGACYKRHLGYDANYEDTNDALQRSSAENPTCSGS